MKRKLYFLIGFLLFVAITVFSVYKLSYIMFDKYNDTRLDPIKFSSLKIDSTKTYDYVFLGDSHAQFWKTKKNNTLNLGISGQTSSQIKIRTLLTNTEIKGKNLILSIGANDVKSIATNPERSDKIVNNCIENINEIVKVLKPNFENIYIITIPPDFSPSFQVKLFNYQKTLNAKKSINSKIKELAKTNNLYFIDTELLLKNKKNLSEDGVHMNASAYGILDKELK